jgi:hypothetical protein
MNVHIWKAQPKDGKCRFLILSGPESMNPAEAYEAGLRVGVKWNAPSLIEILRSEQLVYVGEEPVYETE